MANLKNNPITSTVDKKNPFIWLEALASNQID
jgi:hypothetical protein